MTRRDKKSKVKTVQFDYYGKEIKTHKIWEDRVLPTFGAIFILCFVTVFLWVFIANGNFWPYVLAGLFLFLCYLLILGFGSFLDRGLEKRQEKEEMQERDKINTKAMELRRRPWVASLIPWAIW